MHQFTFNNNFINTLSFKILRIKNKQSLISYKNIRQVQQ